MAKALFVTLVYNKKLFLVWLSASNFGWSGSCCARRGSPLIFYVPSSCCCLVKDTTANTGLGKNGQKRDSRLFEIPTSSTYFLALFPLASTCTLNCPNFKRQKTLRWYSSIRAILADKAETSANFWRRRQEECVRHPLCDACCNGKSREIIGKRRTERGRPFPHFPLLHSGRRRKRGNSRFPSPQKKTMPGRVKRAKENLYILFAFPTFYIRM